MTPLSTGLDPLESYGYTETLVEDVPSEDNDFGNFLEVVNKSGTKFLDSNANGTRDPGEPGIENWTIYAYNAGGLVDQTTTDASGDYSFELSPDTYTFCEDLPGGWMQSFPTSGADCGTLGHAPFGYEETLNAGDNSTGNDFGNFQGVMKSGTKFNDLNRDGVIDPGEPGIENWTIYVYNAGGLVDQTTTDSNGDYSFTLDPDTYTFCEDDPSGWVQSFPASGADCGTLGHAPFGYEETLGSGDTSEDNDFANYQPTVTKSGTKFNDLNANGAFDPGEPGIENWTIYAYNAGGLVDQTTTDASGDYSFTLDADTYTFCEELQGGWDAVLPDLRCRLRQLWVMLRSDTRRPSDPGDDEPRQRLRELPGRHEVRHQVQRPEPGRGHRPR